MLRVAARFGVSLNYMARVCTLLDVPRPGDRLKWTRDGALPKRARSLPKPRDQQPRRKRTAQRQLPDRHPLVGGAKPLFEAGRLSWHGKSLKPAKKLLVDLTVTQTGLDKAIAFANELFLALEARDHRVVTEHWRSEYNELRPHGSLNGLSPDDFLRFYRNKDSFRQRRASMFVFCRDKMSPDRRLKCLCWEASPDWPFPPQVLRVH